MKRMKLKYVLTGGLLITAFAACTNEDFTDVSLPVNTQNAIALGEGYTVKVVKDDAQTRVLWNESGNRLSPVWEETDMLGAAWVHMVTDFDEDGNVTACSNIGAAYGGFYTNHPFTLTSGAGTSGGVFETNTNAFAGAYVLYYPYDDNVAQKLNEFPVKIKNYTFDAEQPLAGIQENMFSYSPVKFVPGGRQTTEFRLQQVAVPVRLYFVADEALNMDLSQGGLSIRNIVLIAKKSGASVLVEKGKIETKTAPDVDDYNEGNLNDIVQYVQDGTTDHLFITTMNTEDNDDYKLLVKATPTVKPFIFSILPLEQAADEVTIKIVTDKGVYATTWTAARNRAKIAEFNKAVQEGGTVSLNVELDVTEKDGVIYTAEEFATRWEEAISKSSPQELTIGTDLVLDDDLECNRGNADVTIRGGHKLTVNNINISKSTNIEFDGVELVADNVVSSGSAEVTFSDLTANNVEIAGKGRITARNIETLTVTSSGVVELDGVAGANSRVGTVNVEKGSTTYGDLTVDNTNLTVEELNGSEGTKLTLGANLRNTGTMTIGDLTASGHTITNAGTMTITGTCNGNVTNNSDGVLTVSGTGTMSGTITNNGTVTLEGDQTGTVTNNYGGTLNINNVESKFTLTNHGTTNIAAEVEVETDGTHHVTNTGIINVAGTLKEAAANQLVQSVDTAEIIAMSADARIERASNASTGLKGYIVILADDNIENPHTDDQVAFDLTEPKTWNDLNTTKTKWVRVKYNATSAELTSMISRVSFAFYNNLELHANMTLQENFRVEGADVKITADGTTARTINIANGKTNEIVKGAKLTLGNHVTLNSTTASTELTVKGDLLREGGAIGTNVTVAYE